MSLIATPALPMGWQCPNCGKAHAPDVKTCPAPPKPKPESGWVRGQRTMRLKDR